VPGRKTDVRDSEWLAQLLELGRALRRNRVVLEWRGMRSARVETAQSTAPDRSGFRKGYWFASRSARPSRDEPTRAKEEDSKRRRAADAVLRAPRRRMGVRQSIGARQSPC